MILGAWVNGDAASRNLAELSVVACRSLINPTLKEAYASARGRFVDVTAASGAYIPFDQAFRDIHARTDGYRLIADLVARQLPRRG